MFRVSELEGEEGLRTSASGLSVLIMWRGEQTSGANVLRRPPSSRSGVHLWQLHTVLWTKYIAETLIV